MAMFDNFFSVSIQCHDEDVPVRGNLCATGDNDEDRRLEASVSRELSDGNRWAWCSVQVIVTHISGSSGEDWLNGCSYKNEQAFREGGYCDDMIETATADCVENMSDSDRFQTGLLIGA